MHFKHLSLLLLFAAFLSSYAKAQTPHLNIKKTRSKAAEAQAYCKAHHFNPAYCVLIDMSLPSGLKRMVVWNFAKKDAMLAGLVSHGCGMGPWSGVWSKDKPAFSNDLNSHCTALGKYAINGRGYSQWGMHVKYYLVGLENSNSNSMRRQVVFHSWSVVPQNEVYPAGVSEGWGCPAISNHNMEIIDKLLRKQKSPVLLWIYN